MEWLSVAGISFAALFPLVNPLGALPLFASLTASDSEQYRKQQAYRTAMWTAIILVAFLYAGSLILAFFGLSLGMLQVAGGLIVGHTGWNMATGTPRVSPSEQKRLVHDKHARRNAFAKLGKDLRKAPKKISEEVAELPSEVIAQFDSHSSVDATSTPVSGTAESAAAPPSKRPDDISFSPMAMPMLAGPGAIGIVIGLRAQHSGMLNSVGILIGILLISLLSLICLLAAKPLTKALGPSGILAMQRIFGFFVLGIAVALVAAGVSQMFGLTLIG